MKPKIDPAIALVTFAWAAFILFLVLGYAGCLESPRVHPSRIADGGQR